MFSLHRFLYEDNETMSLVIKSVTPEDAGMYSITAKNELGEDTSAIKLSIKTPPIIKRPLETKCMVGETAKMCVDITGNPKPTVKFFKNGTEIFESDRIKFVQSEEVNSKITYTVEISKAQLTDAGSYSVTASNDMSQTSDFWGLVIGSPPTIVKKLEREYIHGEKENIIMSIRVDGFPEPKVKWLKEGQEITEHNARVKFSQDGNQYTCTISTCVRTDAARYTVEFENDYGKVHDDTRVFIKCSPQFMQKLTNMTIKEGDTNVELPVVIQGYPK